MSFFYPQQRSGYNQSPFFDLFEQQESPFCSSRPEPYDSYPRRHHSYSRNPPHRHSAGLFHPQDFASPDPYQTTSNQFPSSTASAAPTEAGKRRARRPIELSTTHLTERHCDTILRTVVNRCALKEPEGWPKPRCGNWGKPARRKK
ncbi:hypothetical protein Pst134EA_004853 [Puccinia striiformis f. sp. tritici]|uniref:hypothetical protein n=1 Tax=Puccinia striiformis f. sp. tritici TaxID=168172 RepID=UPI002007E841|nr:hypothetical protein Pst134EA_004853 [Puccinia striiformis f. sp. tritici]KAH9470942.1 hypothetical protein Pst134EA_004853 [Puccinia striiformis f. sp. tritici]